MSVDFEGKDGQPDAAGWPAVISSIEGLVRRLRAQDYRGVDKNALTAEKPSSDTGEDPPSRETIGVVLPSLQQREPIDRWLRAASFQNTMMELTRRISSKLGASRHTTAFISLKPEHLVLSRDDQVIKESDVVEHYTHGQYLGQLMVLDPLFSSLSSDPNSFLPVWWRSRLRRVFVRPWPNEEGAESNGEAGVGGAVRVATRSIDFSMPGQSAKAGDLLLVSNEESTHSLYDIKESGDGWLEVRRNEAVEAERENYRGAPSDGGAWVTDGSCDFRVLRDGSWGSKPTYLRSATRDWSTAGHRDYSDGFRVARTLD